MGTVLTPILTATAGTPQTYNVGIAETYSWVPIVGDALGRPMYARASYITNFSDMSIYLSASELSIGAVTIKDNNSGLNADVVNIPDYGAGLQVLTQDLESSIDDITIGDKEGHYADVVPHLSALQVTVTNLNDSANLDAFGRLRVSNPYTLLDAKHLHGKLPFVFDEALSGTATSTFSAGDSMVVMRTSSENDFVIRQSRVHFNYQPGKSMLAMFTGTFHPETNIIKRVGLIQTLSAIPYNIDDGIYLEVTSTGPRFCMTKTNGVTTTKTIPQSAWNVDKMDGTGQSGITIDFNKSQIFAVDMEWLGLGRVRFGFVQSGVTYYAHYENHVNELISPYIKSPNQPVHYEIRQTGPGTGVMNHICSTVIIEGGEQDIGQPISISDNGIGLVTTEFRPLLFVRYNPAKLDTVAFIKSAEVLNTGGNPALYRVYYNPVITGTQPTWLDIPNTSLQYANGSATTQISGGYVLYSSFMPAGIGGSTTAESLPIPGILARLGSFINGTPDVIVLAAQSIGGAATMYGILNMLERA
jgi:hypothetical protein